MQKDFDTWNILKKGLDEKPDAIPYFKQGEIWWVHLGLNIGYETNGKGAGFMRPVLVLKKYNQHSFLAVPLSTSTKPNPYRVTVGTVGGKLASANLSQLRYIDSRRLINKVAFLEAATFEDIKRKTSEVNLR